MERFRVRMIDKCGGYVRNEEGHFEKANPKLILTRTIMYDVVQNTEAAPYATEENALKMAIHHWLGYVLRGDSIEHMDKAIGGSYGTTWTLDGNEITVGTDHKRGQTTVFFGNIMKKVASFTFKNKYIFTRCKIVIRELKLTKEDEWRWYQKPEVKAKLGLQKSPPSKRDLLKRRIAERKPSVLRRNLQKIVR